MILGDPTISIATAGRFKPPDMGSGLLDRLVSIYSSIYSQHINRQQQSSSSSI